LWVVVCVPREEGGVFAGGGGGGWCLDG